MRLSRGFLPRVAAAVLVAGGAFAAAAAASTPITIAVDASDAPRRIFHVKESIPAAAGTLTLVYPKWIPGEHSAAGPVTDFVGLKVSLAGRALPWKRVPTEMWSVQCEVPAGGGTLDVAFDYVPPQHAWTTATAEILVVNWWPVLLYPQGPNDNATMFNPSLKLPAGWKYGTALPVTGEAGGVITFASTSLVMLIDSPVLAGAYFKTIDLTPGQKPAHFLHLAAESAAALEI
jgi:predicted metalloprotease with PDZ domain